MSEVSESTDRSTCADPEKKARAAINECSIIVLWFAGLQVIFGFFFGPSVVIVGLIIAAFAYWLRESASWFPALVLVLISAASVAEALYGRIASGHGSVIFKVLIFLACIRAFMAVLALRRTVKPPDENRGSKVKTVFIYVSTVILLLGFGLVALNLFSVHSRKASPLHVAAANGDLTAIKSLLASGHDVNEVTAVFGTPLTRATHAGQIEVMKFLLESGANPNMPDRLKWAPLHHAVQSRVSYLDAIHLLIEKGADVNVRDGSLRTPLHRAAQFGQSDAALMLLKCGADPSLKDNIDRTPSQCADRFPDLARYLQEMEGQREKPH